MSKTDVQYWTNVEHSSGQQMRLLAVISAVNCQLPTAVSTCQAAPDSLDCLVCCSSTVRSYWSVSHCVTPPRPSQPMA